MTFKKRLPYYLMGFFIGIGIVFFVFERKNTTFDYGPNARVLKNIRSKKIEYSTQVISLLNSNVLDTTTVIQILKNGNVDLWNKIRRDTCITYQIKGQKNLNNIRLTVNNCDSTSVIEAVLID